MWWPLYLFIVPLVGLTVLVTTFLVWSNRYWKVRGFPSMPVSVYWKYFLRSLFVDKSNGYIDVDIYKYFSGERFGGVVDIMGPSVWITDPELVRSIYVKDFDHFVDRLNFTFGNTPEAQYGNLMVSNISGQLWKDVRNVMTPTFTSGKLKRIFDSLCQCADQLKSYLDKKAESGEEFEVREAYGKFVMDVTASNGFGIKLDSFNNPEANFIKMADRMMRPPAITYIFQMLRFCFPLLLELLRALRFPIPNSDDQLRFFADAVKDTIAERERSGVKGRDFLQLLLDARKGDFDEEKDHNSETHSESMEELRSAKEVLTEPLLIAQCIVFLLGGYETTSSALSFVAYELAVNQDVQEEVYEEIKGVLEKHDGQMTYDAITEMELLDRVFHEAIRIHNPVPRNFRMCTKDYQIPGTDKVIEKGSGVILTSAGFHLDPRNFPNPTKFDPERFSTEEKANRNPYLYQPFGHGPRNCIGMRFAILDSKVALAMTVLNFRVQPSTRTEIPLRHSLSPVMTVQATNGVWLRYEKRNY